MERCPSEWDSVGLSNYLDAGYSVLQRTPLRDIRFLRYSSRLSITRRGCKVELQEDLTSGLLRKKLADRPAPDQVIQEVTDYLCSLSAGEAEKVIIPTSGGFDSRLLNLLLPKKGRIETFSYGPGESQEKSQDVVYARRLSEILGTRWSQIPLRKFNYLSRDWYRLYGLTTHAHGMYQIEFYRKIRESRGTDPVLMLSGIVGDAWAGAHCVPEIQRVEELSKLWLSHNIHASSEAMLGKMGTDASKEEFLKCEGPAMKLPEYRIISLIRSKLVLLNYLFSVPEHIGFVVCTPYLNREIALGMLSLAPDLRENRKWQQEFFRSKGVFLEGQEIEADSSNTLNRQILDVEPLEPLNVSALGTVLRKRYIRPINRTLVRQRQIHFWFGQLQNRGGIPARLLNRLRIGDRRVPEYLKYITLLPLQFWLEKERALKSENSHHF